MWKSLFLPWSPQLNRWPWRRTEESWFALLLGCSLQGWYPTSLSNSLSLSLSLRIFRSSPWRQSAYKGISTEDRMSLSNSKSWDWDGYHLWRLKSLVLVQGGLCGLSGCGASVPQWPWCGGRNGSRRQWQNVCSVSRSHWRNACSWPDTVSTWSRRLDSPCCHVGGLIMNKYDIFVPENKVHWDLGIPSKKKVLSQEWGRRRAQGR